ncbi:MAG TPA: GNAT family N-acetyltransferase [Actinomycetes bacterium]|nr:GNAT family N-acetyltransferase [Actinomycetes bacterium]
MTSAEKGRVARDAELRQRIVTAAAELFAERGYSGTKLKAVAARAQVKPRTVKRLTGSRAQLFAQVLAGELTSQSAESVAAAADNPPAVPLVVLLDTARAIFASPQRSWSLLELEALIRAHRDDDVRVLEGDRLDKRRANLLALTRQARQAGALDDAVDDDALVHFAVALSVGLAVVDQVMQPRPSPAHWDALMGRLGSAVGPLDVLVANEDEARTPWRVRIDIPDRPGGLARLIRALSPLHAHVTATTMLAHVDGVRTIDLAMTVPASVDAETLLAAAMSVGDNGYIAEGSPDDGLDLPTRVLDSATELVTNPGSAPEAVARLVEADRFEVTPSTEGEDDDTDVLRLQWTEDLHVVLHRDWAPFAPAEKARASALLRLAAAIASMEGDPEALGWVEPIRGDGTVWIRLARPEDAVAVAAMHERCSEQTLYQRYLTGVGQWRELTLRRLSGGHKGATLVVMSEEGAIVGLGHVFPDTHDGRTAELAVIVEDAYQGRGIGTRLLRHMVELATRLGFQQVEGTVLAQNTQIEHVLESTRLDWTRHLEGGVVTMRAPLA